MVSKEAIKKVKVEPHQETYHVALVTSTMLKVAKFKSGHNIGNLKKSDMCYALPPKRVLMCKMLDIPTSAHLLMAKSIPLLVIAKSGSESI